jgi:hypothetical protein
LHLCTPLVSRSLPIQNKESQSITSKNGSSPCCKTRTQNFTDHLFENFFGQLHEQPLPMKCCQHWNKCAITNTFALWSRLSHWVIISRTRTLFLSISLLATDKRYTLLTSDSKFLCCAFSHTAIVFIGELQKCLSITMLESVLVIVSTNKSVPIIIYFVLVHIAITCGKLGLIFLCVIREAQRPCKKLKYLTL